MFAAGCGGSSSDGTVGEEIAEDLNKAMDEAREVEEKILEHKDDIDKAMNEAMDAVDEVESQ
jgi:Fe-S cluster biogenesis protein NfuA